MRSGNELVEWTAKAIHILLLMQCYYILEYPMPGRMWMQQVYQQTWNCSTVVLVEMIFQQCGAPHIKPNGQLSNFQFIRWLVGKDGSRELRVSVKGTTWFEGAQTFLTKVAEPYPPWFAQAVACGTQACSQAKKLALQETRPTPLAVKKYDATSHQGENP